MSRLAAASLVLVIAAGPALAQTGCPEFEGITCDGWVTDTAAALGDDSGLEATVTAIVAEHTHQIAVVVIPTSGSLTPKEFAEGIGNTWGVGDAERNDGIVVLVALAERRTEIVTGPGVDIDGLEDIASSGNPYFANGDFNGGVAAILTALDVRLSAPGDQGGGEGSSVWRLVLAAMLITAGGGVVVATRRRHRSRIRNVRSAAVDDVLEQLEPSGHELPDIGDYARPVPPEPADVPTRRALVTLDELSDRDRSDDTGALRALWRWGALDVVDRDSLLDEATEPLELRVSQERDMLEEAVQRAAREAVDTTPGEQARFELRLNELRALVSALRPHRIAEARRRTAEQLADRTSQTPIGFVVATDLGERLGRAGPALDPEAPLTDSIAELDGAYHAASDKVDRLEALKGRLHESTARPAVAAALADLDEEVDSAIERYEAVREELDSHGDALERDGLDTAAVAALLLMNHDEGNVGDFVDTYRERRNDGADPSESVEYALAGLRDRDELSRVREFARETGLPVSITVALMRRRDDGIEVYRTILEELHGDLSRGETRRTVAGVLAISLEPARAVERWRQALSALEALGMEGSYAEVAAAFGASDSRGPREFALAYAATRQAMARKGVEDAERFAPELAHEGTSGQQDSWTGDPIPAGYGSFDPFTFFYYHWVITRGDSGSLGWEATYRDSSWRADRSSWWGGGGGFGGSGSRWGGSSWGSSSGGGGFGGFGGGGGFGGSSGGGSGGSGW